MASRKKTARKQYDEQFRRAAVKKANEIGVVHAASALKIHPSLIYSWKSKDVASDAGVDEVTQPAELRTPVLTSPAQVSSLETRIGQLQSELVRTQRELAEERRDHAQDALKWSNAMAVLIEEWMRPLKNTG